jgi:hypothetical protein
LQTPLTASHAPIAEHTTGSARATSLLVAVLNHGVAFGQDLLEQSGPSKPILHWHCKSLVHTPFPLHFLGQLALTNSIPNTKKKIKALPEAIIFLFQMTHQTRRNNIKKPIPQFTRKVFFSFTHSILKKHIY